MRCAVGGFVSSQQEIMRQNHTTARIHTVEMTPDDTAVRHTAPRLHDAQRREDHHTTPHHITDEVT